VVDNQLVRPQITYKRYYVKSAHGWADVTG
jgi:hypothetical protein